VPEILRTTELSVAGPTVRDMETTGTRGTLRLVRPDETATSTDDLSVEDYWAQVQALRDDLARLRPAN
jgi:hypothetical protein